MVNYKGSTRKIIVAGVSINVPANGKIVMLQDGVNSSSAADGFLDVNVSTIYSVTAGKTLRILGIGLMPSSANAETVVISTGDTENAETATLLTLTNPFVALLQWYAVDIELASAKFLTYNPSSTGLAHIFAIGYEY